MEKTVPAISYKDFISRIERFEENYQENINPESYFGFPIAPVLEIEGALVSKATKNKAYFSMEYGIAPSIYHPFQLNKPISRKNQFYMHDVFSNFWLCDYLFKVKIDKMLDIPIYGGGLGVLAGDAVKSSSDLGYPVAAIGILWNKGYFKQNFWYKHGQVPEELQWEPFTYPGLIPLKNRVIIQTKEGPLHLRLWKYYVYSYDKKHACPIILLDSKIEENQDAFRNLTNQLYRSDEARWKIYQRLILGIGGMKALDSLGYKINCYHLNEGHAAFALLEKYIQVKDFSKSQDFFSNFVYTCHTPVAAGHDRFWVNDIKKIFPDDYAAAAVQFGREEGGDMINLTTMCLTRCSRINAVAKKHQEVMKLQFPEYANTIQAITNGVHVHTWLSESFANLFDKYKSTFGDWRREPDNFTKADQLRNNQEFRKDIFEAHQVNKKNLMKVIRQWQLKEDVLTIGWARRIAGYKRPALIFHKINEILKLVDQFGPIQIVLAGKAHPNDNIGSAKIEEILDHIDALSPYKDKVRVMILENYDTYFGKLLTNSVDVWLNNPLPPFEASGTSGMKAILNGVVQLTTLDGWVVEAENDDIGWIFGYRHSGREIGNEKDLRLDEDSQALYDSLKEIVPLYYKTYQQGKVNVKSPWIDKMINCICRSAFFNTNRMMQDYNQNMWL